MEKITLKKIEHLGKTQIAVLYRKHPDFISKIKKIKGRRWSKTKNCWYLPYTSASFKSLKEVFGEAILEYDKKQSRDESSSINSTAQAENINKAIPLFTQFLIGDEVRKKVLGEKIIASLSGQNHFDIYIPYDKKGWIEMVKIIPGRMWNMENACWRLPNVKKSYRILKKHIGLQNIIFNFKISSDIPETTNYFYSPKREQPKQKYKLNEFQNRAVIKLEEQLLKEHKSPRTIKTYKGLFVPFLAYYPNIKPSQISREQIERYFIYKKQDNISDSSINQLINALNCFYGRILQHNEKVNQIIRPKKKKKLPNVFSMNEIENILKSTENIKHKCMLILIYSSGLRKSELLNLHVEDLSFDRKTIFIKNAKGGKDRYTFFADSARRFIKEYLKAYNPAHYLFEGMTGGRYSESSLQGIYEQVRKKAKVNRFVTLHGLRHSFATHLIEKGVPLHVIQELLGHNSIKTTEIYLHISNKYRSQLKSPLDDMDI